MTKTHRVIKLSSRMKTHRLNRHLFRSVVEDWGEFDTRITNKTTRTVPLFKVKLEVDGPASKTDIPPSELRTRALDVLEKNCPSDTWVRAYTDGSKNKKGSGWGCTLRFPDGEEEMPLELPEDGQTSSRLS